MYVIFLQIIAVFFHSIILHQQEIYSMHIYGNDNAASTSTQNT